MQLDLEEIRAVAKLVREKGLDQVIIESTDPDAAPCRLELRHEVIVAESSAPALSETGEISQKGEQETGDEGFGAVTSPAVGIFHYDAEKVQVGMHVDEGQIVGTVESLRIPTEVRASEPGVIDEILVTDGEGVEYDEPLMKLQLDT